VRSAGLSVEVLPATERDSVGVVWERLEAEGADPGPLASWQWTRTWLEHFGSTVSHCFAVVRSGRRPLGAALLTFDRRRRGPFTFRRVHLGTAGEPPEETVFTERNRLLARPEDAAQVGAAIIGLLESLPGIDEIVVDGFVVEQLPALIGGVTDGCSSRSGATWWTWERHREVTWPPSSARGCARNCAGPSGPWGP